MKRRDFIKSGLASLASTRAMNSPGSGQGPADRDAGTYGEGQKLVLTNECLDWELLMTGGGVRSLGFRNKLSGHYYKMDESKELSLTFSQARARVEIPWWYVELGPDNDKSSPAQEQGYLRGYHLEDFREQESWKTSQTLLYEDVPPIFNGYAWFRQSLELPADAQGQPVVLCLGGYNQEDWNQYWVFVNGEQVGNWKGAGRWRTPKELHIRPGTKEYGVLKFGSTRKNLLAIRVFQTDKRFEGIREEILDRYLFEGRLCDQFISLGQPYVPISDFRLDSWRRRTEGGRPGYVLELINSQEQLRATAYFELDGFIRRKWLVIKNAGPLDRLLLDVDVDDFRCDAPMSEGDYGYPVMVREEVFCAVEHPAGLNQGTNGRVRLRHFPGKRLAPGDSIQSKVAIIGVGPQGSGRQQFVDYIQSLSPRRKMVSIYDPLGINGFPDEPCWALNDEEMLESVDLLENWQRQHGVKFDYYVPDVGWQDWTGDLTRFWPHGFPEGADKVIKRVNEVGMKWGLWFCGTWGDWSCGLNPKTIPSRTLVAGGKWPDYQFRDNFDIFDGARHLCLASEPYLGMLRYALLDHIRNHNLRFFKLDGSNYFCNNPDHGHLPGKYSTEASLDAVIETARLARQAAPDLYIMWYWGVRSPFFALHGDSIFESRIRMEGASTGDYPALFFRDAVTLAMDQGVHFNDLIPPMNKDSLGIWITDTSWGNAMRKERWREALVMDLGRGNLLFPQLWGDLQRFSTEDVAFLARIQKLAKENEEVFYKRKKILGDAWENDIYGYAYFRGAHGFLFMNNMSFQPRRLSLKLDQTIGLSASPGTRVNIFSHFPEQARLDAASASVFQAGQTIETWLRPFEVAMWELTPEQPGAELAGFQERRLAREAPDVPVHRLSLETLGIDESVRNLPGYSGMEIHYGPPDPGFRSTMPRPTLEEFKRMGYTKRILGLRTALPDFGPGPHVLAIVLRFRREGKWWRYRQPADLVQAKGAIGGQPILRFEAVPNFRQTENNEWCPWLVFKIRTNHAWSGKDLLLAINAYLPPEVEIETEGWLVPQWWKPSPAM